MKNFTSSIGCLLALLVVFPAGNARSEVGLSSAEQLPVDRFDEYPAGKFPPPPWERVGPDDPGLSLSLEACAESPFPANAVHGKGFRLKDETGSVGNNAGLAIRFLSAPEDRLYLGFDFQLEPGEEGVDLLVALTDETGEGLQLTMSRKDGLRVLAGDGKTRKVAPLEEGKWYHLGTTIGADRRAGFELFTSEGKTSNLPSDRVPVVFPEESPFSFPRLPVLNETVLLPGNGRFCRLSFVSPDAAGRRGAWMIDNIAMAGQVDANRLAWLPFQPLPTEKMRKLKHKVLAYYYPIYPTGASSQDTGLSWYALSTINASIPIDPKRVQAGTKYFYHPLLRPPLEKGLSREEELLQGREEEIRLAKQMGLDGFVVDFFSYPGEQGGQEYFQKISFAMLDAAARMDPDFKIIPAVYARGEDADPVQYANSPVFERAFHSPATMRTSDGRMVISMWLTERYPAEWWKKALAELERLGRPASLLTQFNSMGKLGEFAPIVEGMSHWGPRTPLRTNWVEKAREHTKLVVAPVAPHDIRSRGSIFWEAENFDTLRRSWQTAIEDHADWVCINTWSDYSEQAMAPSTAIGFAPYDISAYYAQWFKTGEAPEIIRDVLYYSYRRHHSSLEPTHGQKWKAVKVAGKDTAEDQIELLSFLKEPGELQIHIDDKVYRKEAEAGITSFKIPLPTDKAFTPKFALLRSGKPVIEESGRTAVLDRIEFPNMLYYSGVLASDN